MVVWTGEMVGGRRIDCTGETDDTDDTVWMGEIPNSASGIG